MELVTVTAPIEVDITQTNKAWFTLKKKKDRTPKPQYVIGFYQRVKESDNCRLLKLPDMAPGTIERFVKEVCQEGGTLYCESGILPASLKKVYTIEELDAPKGEHVRGDVHINNIKNAWRDLKRNIKREYISVSSWHLDLYLGEVAFFINNRNLSQAERFEKLLGNVANSTHTTYAELTSRNPNKKSTAVSHQKLPSSISP